MVLVFMILLYSYCTGRVLKLNVLHSLKLIILLPVLMEDISVPKCSLLLQPVMPWQSWYPVFSFKNYSFHQNSSLLFMDCPPSQKKYLPPWICSSKGPRRPLAKLGLGTHTVTHTYTCNVRPRVYIIGWETRRLVARIYACHRLPSWRMNKKYKLHD